MADLTCAVVHWNVPDLLAECLGTLLAEVEGLEARGLAVDVLVVDNASRPEVRERLRRETPDGVRILWPEENLGYPRACNLAYDAADSPLVLLSNPDIVYLTGSLAEPRRRPRRPDGRPRRPRHLVGPGAHAEAQPRLSGGPRPH